MLRLQGRENILSQGRGGTLRKEYGSQETSFIQSGSGGAQKTNVFEMGSMAGVRNEVEELRKVRDLLVGERQKLDDKLHEQKSLSSSEERRMIELDESVEAIDGAIEYKNDIICGKQVVYDASYNGEDALMKHLVRLGVAETRAMLHRYFVRVLDLRMEGRHRALWRMLRPASATWYRRLTHLPATRLQGQ